VSTEATNVQSIKAWVRANRPDLVGQIDTILEGERRGDTQCRGLFLLLCVGYEAGLSNVGDPLPIAYEPHRKHLREMIPLDTLAHLDAYENERHPVGGFLHAVLSNRLYNALSRADEANLRCLRWIVQYVDGHMNPHCRGSEEAVQLWLNPPPPPLNEPSTISQLEAGDTFVFADEERPEAYQARGNCWYNTPGKQVGGPWHEDDRERPVIIHQRAKS